MHEIISFVQAHAALCGLFVLTLGYIIWLETRQSAAGPALNAQACVHLMNQSHALVWDLRDQAAFDAGHIVHAKRVDMDDTQAQLEALPKSKRDKPLVLVCEQGVAAGKAAMLLRKAGHANVQVMAGGMADWRRSGMPVVQHDVTAA